MPTPNYGTCMSIMDDLPNVAALLSGIAVLVQDIYHLLTTVRGTCAPLPEFGFGLTDELLSAHDPDSTPAIASSVQAALEDDDRIALADVQIDPDPSGVAILTIAIDPTVGPAFRLVGPLSSLIVELTANA